MRVATWNVNSLNARMTRFVEWIKETSPDVVCIQETKMKPDVFPYLELESLGYEAAHFGQGQWNGVAIISKVGLSEVIVGLDGDGGANEEARAISANCGGVNIVSVYVPNGRALDNDHYRYKLEWLKKLRVHLDRNYSADQDVIVAGDFNIAPGDIDVWSPEVLVGSTHVSQPERDALQELVQWGLIDAFRTLWPEPEIYSWWDHRGGAFHKRQGMRIDYLLVSHSIENCLSWALIDRNARKGEKPSDHAPVTIEFETAK